VKPNRDAALNASGQPNDGSDIAYGSDTTIGWLSEKPCRCGGAVNALPGFYYGVSLAECSTFYFFCFFAFIAASQPALNHLRGRPALFRQLE
jgi:hypothetical protein